MAFCAHCGTQMSDQAVACPSCGHPAGRGGIPAGVAIPNYMVQSILTTLFCCLPFGIVAIVFASKVNSKLAVGDVAGAQDSSNKAKMWSWISFGVGLAIIVLGILAQVGSISSL